jgi:hypothetical protein
MRSVIISNLFLFFFTNFATAYFCTHDAWQLAPITVLIMGALQVARLYAGNARDPNCALPPQERWRRVTILVWTTRLCALATAAVVVLVGPLLYARGPSLIAIGVAVGVLLLTFVVTEFRRRSIALKPI